MLVFKMYLLLLCGWAPAAEQMWRPKGNSVDSSFPFAFTWVLRIKLRSPGLSDSERLHPLSHLAESALFIPEEIMPSFPRPQLGTIMKPKL